jgi:6-phosphogluconolactonase
VLNMDFKESNPNNPPTERFFGHLSALMATLAEEIARSVQDAIDQRGRATLILPGGRSAPALFAALREQTIAWENVVMSLSDERWVPREHPESNEGLIARHFLVGPAAAAKVIGLYQPGISLAQAPEVCAKIAGAARLWPADVCVLGMGEDGHTASIFPSSPPSDLKAALDPAPGQVYAPAHPSASPWPRLTVTLPVLRAARRLILLIPGSAKLPVYHAALEPGPTTEMPVRGILRREPDVAGTEVWWSP